MATYRELQTGNGEKRWKVEVARKGYPRRSATFTTYRDAERWARKLEGEIATTRNLPDLEAERHTVDELLNRWEPELTEKRRKAVRSHIAWWRAAIGARRLSEVSSALLREMRDRLAREPYKRSAERKAVTLTPRRKPKAPAKPYKRTPATVNRYFETMATALDVGRREYEWLRLNPARNVADLREPQGRARFLSDDERATLLKACEAESRDIHALVVTALCTGARAGELLSLRWPDVDLARKRAILHQTKNSERRALSLAGPAFNVLRDRSKVRRIDTDLVFPDPAPGRDRKPRRYDYAKVFRKVLGDAGIENFRFHDLRHTAASYLAMNGATTAEIAAVLGHKTLAMVKRYSHLTETHVSSVVERMTDAIFPGA
jgi:integrase